MWHNFGGNQKNNHSVCASNEAGYAEYSGLPEEKKQDVWRLQSSKATCSLHKPCEMITTERGGHRVIETILKKMTRNKTLYEDSVKFY